MPIAYVRTQLEDFDIQREIARVTDGNKNIGAVVTFSGLCRDEEATLSALELEHYPEMAESEMRKVARQAIDRFGLDAISVTSSTFSRAVKLGIRL